MNSCYLKALKLLALAEHSRKGLEQKLIKRGFLPEVVKETLNLLEKEGSLNEERFAEEWIRSRLRKRPIGKNLLIRELEKRGIEEELAIKVVGKATDWPEYKQGLKRVWEAIQARGELEREKISRYLHQKGYSLYEIRMLFEEFD
ncbi:MAG: regulatory protein RecX [Spirochaetales bacterium]